VPLGSTFGRYDLYYLLGYDDPLFLSSFLYFLRELKMLARMSWTIAVAAASF
jgi:hypothetical protein